MIMTGMGLNLNINWNKLQLTPKIQQIFNKHHNHFEGKRAVQVSQMEMEDSIE